MFETDVTLPTMARRDAPVSNPWLVTATLVLLCMPLVILKSLWLGDASFGGVCRQCIVQSGLLNTIMSLCVRDATQQLNASTIK